MHISELKRMGANIKLKGSKLKIIGVEELLGAEVMATDLRSLVIFDYSRVNGKWYHDRQQSIPFRQRL